MKKLIGLLAATGLIAGAGATAVSCGCGKKDSAELKALKNVSIHLNENDSKDINKVFPEVEKQLKANSNNNIKNATITKDKPTGDKKSDKGNEYLVYVSMSNDKTKAILELFYAKDKGDSFKSQGNYTTETKTTESNKFDLKLLDVKLTDGMIKKDAEKAIKDAINLQSGVTIEETNYTLVSNNVHDPIKKDDKFTIKTNVSAKFIKGEKEITVLDSTTKKEDLNDVIKVKDLGQIDNKEADTIKKALKAKNSNFLDVDQLDVENILDSKATIKAKKDSPKYIGQVDVTYSVKENLNDVIKVKDLGQIDNKEADTIKKALKTKNSNFLDVDQLDVENILDSKATIKAKKDSPKYIGQVDVTYSVKENLNDVIKVKDLGQIDNKEADTIKKALKTKNSNFLDVDQLDVENILDSKATIKAKKDSPKYIGQVDVTYTIKK